MLDSREGYIGVNEVVSAVWSYLVGNPATGTSISVIVVLFVLALWHFIPPLRSRWRAFGDASESLSSGGQSGFPSDPPFAKKHSKLRKLWRKYAKRYRRASVEIEGETLSPISPEEIFTRGQVLGDFNRGASLALAGVFAGLGILGTFVGLVLGLQGIAIDAETSQKTLESVNSLLGGMSTAFMSSIAGISASLLWLALDRWSLKRVDRAAREFFDRVRDRWPVTSAERMSFRIAELEKQQTTILQNLGTDLSQAFQDAIDKSFSQKLSPALDSIDATLESVASEVRDEQAEAMDELAEAFQERLLGSVNEQFGELQETIEETTEWQKRVTSDVGEVFEQVSQLSEMNTELIENSSEAAETFLASVDRLSESHERVGETGERLEAVARQTGALAEELESQVEVFQDSNREIREQLAQQLDAVQRQVQELEGFWTDLQTDLQRLSSQLSETLTELTEQTEERLGQVFERFDGEMGTIVEHLSGTLADLREVNEDIVPAVRGIERALDETIEPIQGARDGADELAESIRALDGLPEELKSTSEEIGGARSRLSQLSDNLEELNRELSSLSENGTEASEPSQGRSVEDADEDIDSGGSFFPFGG